MCNVMSLQLLLFLTFEFTITIIESEKLYEVNSQLGEKQTGEQQKQEFIGLLSYFLNCTHNTAQAYGGGKTNVFAGSKVFLTT